MRWASSHNNTFTFAVVSGQDEEWIHHKQYYEFVDDYIASAPIVTNRAVRLSCNCLPCSCLHCNVLACTLLLLLTLGVPPTKER